MSDEELLRKIAARLNHAGFVQDVDYDGKRRLVIIADTGYAYKIDVQCLDYAMGDDDAPL